MSIVAGCDVGSLTSKAVIMKNVPKYAEVIQKGIGAFLHDPAKADPKRIYYE